MSRTTTTRQTANGPTAPMRPHSMGPNVRAAPRTQPDETAVSLPRRVWDEVAPRRSPERVLWWVGGLLVLSGVVHTVVWLASGEPWAGSVSWRKPIVFGLSFGVTLVSQAWVMRHLPATRRLAWVLATGLAGSAALEVALITMQRWRGVPSHFNYLTPFDTVVFGIMAQSVFLFAGLTVLVLVWAAWRLPRGVVRIAAVAGLVVLLVAQGLGAPLVAAGNAFADTHGGQAPVEHITFGGGGLGTLPHGLAIHGLQVLGGLAVLLGVGYLGASRQRRIMWAGVAGYAILVAWAIAQTYLGRAPLDLSVPAVVALSTSAVVLLGAFASAMAGLRLGSVTPRDGGGPGRGWSTVKRP